VEYSSRLIQLDSWEIGASTVIALAVGLSLTLVHEILHIVIHLIETGERGSLRGDLFGLYVSTSTPVSGLNALVTVVLTIALSLGLLYGSKWIYSDRARWGVILGSGTMWFSTCLYGMGMLVPLSFRDGRLVQLGGDGGLILYSFGLWGILPSGLLLIFGTFLVWERLTLSFWVV